MKNELESEYKERRSELTQYEKRIIAKEETLDKRYDVLKGEEQLIENKKKKQTIYTLKPKISRSSRKKNLRT